MSGLNYFNIASLVLHGDRDRNRNDKEPDGAPTSLAPVDVEKKKKRAAEKQDPTERQPAKRKQEANAFGFTDTSLRRHRTSRASRTHEHGACDRPRTAETREAIRRVRSAADTVLESSLQVLSKTITDYGAEDETAVDPDIERKTRRLTRMRRKMRRRIGSRTGRESEDEGEDGEGAAEGAVVDGEGDEELVIGGESSGQSRGKAKVDKDIVQPQVSEASSVLVILGSESARISSCNSSSRATMLSRNVVWCTKLARSDTDERVNVEVAMRENDLGWVLRELAGDRQAKANAEDAMYVDAPASSTQVLKSATLAPGSVVQPKKTSIGEGGGFFKENRLIKICEGDWCPHGKGRPVHLNPSLSIGQLCRVLLHTLHVRHSARTGGQFGSKGAI
ncbi:hypothetical protein FA95DRAFT_1584819 [Auriscalpium vulgare]|uniref:Uncharacterized protein n=1 Tax=Auriscalpium vulgare TaxID=40419 RepID=A0ACB8RAH7_9AGAM|nr:hypothetical protein FA95DRAFT_1584819 [Auriscalpium vulgare]